MGNQSASRLEGDRYQHLYSWYILLQLLDIDSIWDHAFVEHPEAGAADDVTLHPKGSSGNAARFYQIKWHTDQRSQYSFDSLCEPLSGKRSLLQKLYDSWKMLRAQGAVEVWLVSNWAAHPVLGNYIRGRGHNLSEDFLDCGEQSEAGQGRRKWQTQIGATDEEMRAFCGNLRLRLGFAGVSDLEEMTDDRMARHSLRTGTNPRAVAIDEVSAWIEQGGKTKKVTKESLLEVVERRQLRASSPEEPKVSLWIHGWAKRSFDSPPTIELDWTAHFHRDTRQIPDQAVWRSTLLPELRQAKSQLSSVPEGHYIDFRGKLPLTIGLAVGAEFPDVGGFSFRVEQPTRQENFLWNSSAKPSERFFEVGKEKQRDTGQDILVGLAITGNAEEDLENLYDAKPNIFKALIYAEPDSGPGDASISGESDAVALAIKAKELIRVYRRKYRAIRTHLVLYCPAAFSLFLGQRFNSIGDVVTYERTTDGFYQASVTIQTG